MNVQPLTELFERDGALIEPTAGESPFDLDGDRVASLFEAHGALVFRGFDLNPTVLSRFTDQYTEKYARDAMRRNERFENKVVRDVDVGTDAHTLHSEASYAPAWPEIIWFFCAVPPADGGATTLCDGLRLWKALSVETRDLFHREPLRFDLEIPVGAKRPGRGRQVWLGDVPGARGYMEWDTGSLSMVQLRFAMQEDRASSGLCFSNHLQAELGKDPQIRNTRMMFASGTPVPEEVLVEIRERAAQLTYEHGWERHDLVMLDNRRFMHGRRAFTGPRDVVIVQTARASFGYGSTTRRRIREGQPSSPARS